MPVYYKNTDSLISFEKKRTGTHPKSSWDNVMDQLFKLHILIMPEANLKTMEVANDCDGVSVEVATKKSYKIYSYGCIFLNVSKPEFKDMQRIVDLLKKEFEINSTRRH